VRTEAAATYQPLNETQLAELKRWWDVQPVVDVPVAPSPGTKVLIVKFSDYQCPGCRAAHEALRPVLANFRDQPVEYVMKHYPLEPECNANSGGNHFSSCEAAAAYEMTRGNPRQAELDDWLFANQTSLNRDVVKKAAQDITGVTDYDARYETAVQAVKTDASLGATMKIRSTPTFFINGRRIEGGLVPAALDGLIKIILNEGTK
jgi:protein-disulfide isomerase